MGVNSEGPPGSASIVQYDGKNSALTLAGGRDANALSSTASVNLLPGNARRPAKLQCGANQVAYYH